MSEHKQLQQTVRATLVQALQAIPPEYRRPFHLFVGFSGGVDSLALLLSCAECLRSPHLPVATPPIASLQAIHVNHQLSVHAQAWALQCEAICRALQIPCVTRTVCLAADCQQQSGLEAAARQVRFQAFADVIAQSGLGGTSLLLLAHHQQDQAETILFRLVRGAGIKGLCGIPRFSQQQSLAIVRPFLSLPKSCLVTLAQHSGFAWVNDESNQDTALSRNYIRQLVIPLLQQRWPSVQQTISRTAVVCTQTQQALDELLKEKYQIAELSREQLDTLLKKSAQALDSDKIISGLCLVRFRQLSSTLQPMVLRAWLSHYRYHAPSAAHLESLLVGVIHASADSQPRWEWGGTVIWRFKKELLWAYLQQTQTV